MKKDSNLIQAYRQAPWRMQLQLIGLFSLGVVLVALVAGIYLNVTARAATIGREIQVLQSEVFAIQRANADFETQLALLTSARVMEDRARALGFQPIDSNEALYVMVSGYAGREETILAPPPGPISSGAAPLPPEFTQTLLDWVVDAMVENSDSMSDSITSLQELAP